MRPRNLIYATALLVLAGASVAYAYRVPIRDVIEEARRPALPEARSYVPPVATTVSDEEVVVSDIPISPPSAVETPPATTVPVVEEAVETDVPTPTAINLAVPFTSQAPHGDWSMPFQEACEEAALIMVNAWMVGTPPGTLDPDVVEPLIRSLVAWEMEHFGYYEDTTAAETARIAKEYYGYAHTVVLPVTSIEDVKMKVAEGHAVILPASGTKLMNPHFRGGGPVYHMLVVKGYTADGRIITNDPGTRVGADYLYDPDTLFDAIGDWNGGDPAHGAKVMIVIQP